MDKPKSHFWPLLVVLTISVLHLQFLGSSAAKGQTPKPRLRVEADGLPGGHDTPEGAACDLARAFINRDEKLFSSTSIKPYGRGKGRDLYEKFLQDVIQSIKAESAQKEPSPQGPKSIGKVFAARHLSKSGPVSWAYAAHGFQDVMFVDVGVYLWNGERALNRTLVIKDSHGRWYVHPDPAADPLLIEGLNEEKESVLDLTDAYELERP